jgi:hypothetical protein
MSDLNPFKEPPVLVRHHLRLHPRSDNWRYYQGTHMTADRTFVRVPLTLEQMEILHAHGNFHIRVGPDGQPYYPILEALFYECRKVQRPDETIADVLVRALQVGAQ